jgi:uncharacterized protein YggU (UPF0235/DUF167 family)
MIRLEAHAEGTILPIKAHAAARRNEIRLGSDGTLHVSVTQAPEKGKANKAILALLAKSLGLRNSQFALLSGATSPQKRILVRGLSPQEVQARLPSLVE